MALRPGNGVDDQVPAAFEVVVDKRFDQELVHICTVIIPGKGPELSDQAPEGAPLGLPENHSGGARAPLAGTQLIFGGGFESN